VSKMKDKRLCEDIVNQLISSRFVIIIEGGGELGKMGGCPSPLASSTLLYLMHYGSVLQTWTLQGTIHARFLQLTHPSLYLCTRYPDTHGKFSAVLHFNLAYPVLELAAPLASVTRYPILSLS
jgi:hypothetical protein